MDKTEYQIKLDEINRLIDLQEYEDALEIIDTIEWKRVKSARTLCMVAEIYEINGELEESMRILQLAYKRSSLGKTILYRQVELALKMKKYDDAVKYYNKYLEAASNDTTKYILKYKIYKAQRAPLEDLIAILEEYKEREYTERWVYELARLYKQAGNQRKCVETCDDLILWFGEGKYVIKAMELKMTYVPLTAAQKAKYDQRIKQEAKQAVESAKAKAKPVKAAAKSMAEPVKAVAKPMAEPVKPVVKPTVEPIKTTVKLSAEPVKKIVKSSAETSKSEVKSTVSQKKLVPPSFESISAAAKNTPQKYPSFIRKEPAFVPPVLEETPELLKEAAVTIEQDKDILKNVKGIEETIKSAENAVTEENVKAEEIVETEEIIEAVDIVVDPVENEELSIESILAAAAAEIMAEKEAEEKITDTNESVRDIEFVPEEPLTQHKVVDNEELQKNLAKSLEQVFSGLNRSKMVQSFDSFGRHIGNEIPKEILDEENMEDYLMKDLEPEITNETYISMEPVDSTDEIKLEEETLKEEPVEETPEEVLVEEPVEETPEEVLAEEPAEETPEEVLVEEPAEETPEEVLVEEPVEETTEETLAEEPVEETPEETLVEMPAEENLLEEKTPEEELNTEVVEENNFDNFELDLEALFAETSNDFARMIENFANANEEEFDEIKEPEEKVEETEEEIQEIEEETEKAEEEIQEIEEETEKAEEEIQEIEEETEKAEEEIQETEEETQETEEEIQETEEETEKAEEEIQEPEEKIEKNEDEIDAEAAMLAFESSLLEGLMNIPGLENYQFEEIDNSETNTSEETGNPDTSESPVVEESTQEEVTVEVEEPAQEEVPVEVEEPAQEEVPVEVEASAQEEVPVDLETPEKEALSTENKESELFDFEALLVAETESVLKIKENDKEPEKEMDLVERLMMEADQEPSTYQSLADETPEDKRRRILNENSPTTLTEEQKALFSYFCKVPGMNNQILDAINGVYRYADERTSRRGNIAIMGNHGMGKTRLGEGLVKAICKRFGIEAAKYARIDALELNKKDIATVVGKMAGGFLMIERAHLMTPATVGQLATAMEFRTDSMVLIIEDEKAEMRQLLAEYPHFAEKFETIISIPVFTNDELVTFARTYAKENGFKMDELGVLALYALIGDNQREDEPVTIGRVKSMVDMAIRHATNARLGRRLSKRHVDEDGRILLYEKDFED